jgi:pimeloyl-ACP methyl ester carboxylesterase
LSVTSNAQRFSASSTKEEAMDRRSFIAASGAGLVTVADRAEAQSGKPSGKPIVLVHGAWHGGWCFKRLAPLLEQAGHPVTAPTLTGLGERRHLMSRAVVLDTHIADVVQHVENEELTDIVLVGHSYGGFAVTGAIEQIGPRVAHLILLDAFHPRNGESVLDYAGEPRRSELLAAAAKDPNWNIPAPPGVAFGVTDKAQAEWLARRLSPQPFGPYAQPIRIASGVAGLPRRSYISCDSPALPVLDSTRQRLQADATWTYVALDAPHDVMVTDPRLLADTLLRLIA